MVDNGSDLLQKGWWWCMIYCFFTVVITILYSVHTGSMRTIVEQLIMACVLCIGYNVKNELQNIYKISDFHFDSILRGSISVYIIYIF